MRKPAVQPHNVSPLRKLLPNKSFVRRRLLPFVVAQLPLPYGYVAQPGRLLVMAAFFSPFLLAALRNTAPNAVPPRIVGIVCVPATFGLFTRQKGRHYGILAYPLRPFPVILKRIIKVPTLTKSLPERLTVPADFYTTKFRFSP